MNWNYFSNQFCSENVRWIMIWQELKGEIDWFSAHWQVLNVSITQYFPNFTTNIYLSLFQKKIFSNFTLCQILNIFLHHLNRKKSCHWIIPLLVFVATNQQSNILCDICLQYIWCISSSIKLGNSNIFDIWYILSGNSVGLYRSHIGHVCTSGLLLN